IDCTTIGAPPPTATPPTFALRVACLGMMELSMVLMGIKRNEERSLSKREARDVLARIRRKVDRFSAVNQGHDVRVAEHDVEWRRTIDRLDRSRRPQARDDGLATAIADLRPRRTLIRKQQCRVAGRRTCRERRAAGGSGDRIEGRRCERSPLRSRALWCRC